MSNDLITNLMIQKGFLRDAAKEAYRQWIKPWSPSALARRRIYARAKRNVRYVPKIVATPTRKELRRMWLGVHGTVIPGEKRRVRSRGWLAPTSLMAVLTGSPTHKRVFGTYYKTGSYNLPRKQARQIFRLVMNPKGLPKKLPYGSYAVHATPQRNRLWFGVKRALRTRARGKKLKWYQARLLNEQLGSPRIKFGDIRREMIAVKPTDLPSQLSAYRMGRVRGIAQAAEDFRNIDIPRLQFAGGGLAGGGIVGGGILGYRRMRRKNGRSVAKRIYINGLRKGLFGDSYDYVKRKWKKILNDIFIAGGIAGLLAFLYSHHKFRVRPYNKPKLGDSPRVVRNKIDSIVRDSDALSGLSEEKRRKIVAQRNKLLGYHNLKLDTERKYRDVIDVPEDEYDDEQDIKRLLEDKRSQLIEERHKLEE